MDAFCRLVLVSYLNVRSTPKHIECDILILFEGIRTSYSLERNTKRKGTAESGQKTEEDEDDEQDGDKE